MRKWDRLGVCSSRSPMTPPERGLVWEDYVIEIDYILDKLSATSLHLSSVEQKEAQSRRDKARIHKRKTGTYPSHKPLQAQLVEALRGLVA